MHCYHKSAKLLFSILLLIQIRIFLQIHFVVLPSFIPIHFSIFGSHDGNFLSDVNKSLPMSEVTASIM